MKLTDNELRDLHVQACAAVLKQDRTVTPADEAFWPLYIQAVCEAQSTGNGVDLTIDVPWRCFHCDATFSDADEAREHFGSSLMHEPACQIDIAKYREMETRVERCNAEDSDVHREMYGMVARHQLALRREEEKGYARGLKDGQELAASAASDASANAAPASGEKNG